MPQPDNHRTDQFQPPGRAFQPSRAEIAREMECRLKLGGSAAASQSPAMPDRRRPSR